MRAWRHIAIPAVAFLLAFQSLGAQNADRAGAINRLKEEIKFIDKELKETSAKHKESYNQLLLLQKKSANRKKLVEESDRAIKDLEAQISQKDRQISDLQANLDTLQKYYSTLVYNTYKNRDRRLWLMYLLASENPGQGYRRFNYLKGLSETMNAEAQEIMLSQARLQSEKEQLEAMYSRADSLRRDRQMEYSALKSEERQTQKVVNTLAKDKKKYKAALEKKRKEMDRLNKEVKKAVKGELAKKDKIDYNVSGRFYQNKGKIPWPVKGVVTEQFGVHKHPIYKNITLPESDGITITAAAGSQARCVFEGIVKQIMLLPGYSHCILVQHGEYFTFYCKLGKTNVKPGQKVKAGDVLGTIETDGGSAQLHFQVWKGSEKQNPSVWLN